MDDEFQNTDLIDFKKLKDKGKKKADKEKAKLKEKEEEEIKEKNDKKYKELLKRIRETLVKNNPDLGTPVFMQLKTPRSC